MRRALLILLLTSPAFAGKASKAKAVTVPKEAPAEAPDTVDGGDLDTAPAPGPRALGPIKGAPHKEGEYGGVTPGQKPEGKARRPTKGTLSWIGFEAKSDGGAQVFFQSPGPFEVTQHVEGATLVVELALPRLGANAWRQVDTRYFDNPLAGIQAKAVGARGATKASPARARGVEVRIAFKNAKDAREGTVATKTEADGLYYAYLSFPQGTAVEGGPAGQTPKTGGDVEK